MVRSVLLLVVALLSTSACPAGVAEAEERPPGAAEGVRLGYEHVPMLLNALLRWEVDGRVPQAGWNAATVFVDHNRLGAKEQGHIERLKAEYESALVQPGSVRKRLARVREVPLDFLAAYLEDEALAGLRAERVQTLLAVSAFNQPEKAHSEVRLRNFVKPLGRPVLLGSSDRRQCWTCSGLYLPGVPLFHGVDYDLTPDEVVRLEREREAAVKGIGSKTKRSAAYNKVDKRWRAVARERNAIAHKQLMAIYAQVLPIVAKDPDGLLRAAHAKLSTPLQKCLPPRPGGAARQAFLPRRRAARSPGCEPGRAPTGFSRAVSEPALLPGGIDFTSLELRYLSDPGDGSGVRYSFAADRAPRSGDPHRATALTAARQSSDAFFVWLALDPADFWVNLHPDQPDVIIDERLGRTDAGRIMLEADLRLKKDVGAIIHPDTVSGRAYWDGLEGKCASVRVWITPAPAEVYADGDELHILDAPLKVELESVDARESAGSSRDQVPAAGAAGCRQGDAAERAHDELLGRRIVLPRLEHLVNNARAYADLRRIHFARVAAEWYRDLSIRQRTAYGALIGSGAVDDRLTVTGWQPRDTFRAFVRSYRDGEYHADRRLPGGMAMAIVYGGVDLSRVPFRRLSADAFASEHPELAAGVGRSLAAPAKSEATGSLWLGSPTPLQSAAGERAAGRGVVGAVLTVLGYAAALSGVAAAAGYAVAVRRRRRRREPDDPAPSSSSPQGAP